MYTILLNAQFQNKDHIFPTKIGLPTVPYFPGRPVFQPLCPASRLESSRDARCPYFGLFIAFVSNTSFRIEFQYKVSRYDSSSWSPVALTTNFEAPETYFALFLQRFLSQIFSLMKLNGQQRGTGHLLL